jgi:hypothetical protein
MILFGGCQTNNVNGLIAFLNSMLLLQCQTDKGSMHILEMFYLIASVLALALQGPKCRNLSKLIHVQQRIASALMSARKSRHTLPHIPVCYLSIIVR